IGTRVSGRAQHRFLRDRVSDVRHRGGLRARIHVLVLSHLPLRILLGARDRGLAQQPQRLVADTGERDQQRLKEEGCVIVVDGLLSDTAQAYCLEAAELALHCLMEQVLVDATRERFHHQQPAEHHFVRAGRKLRASLGSASRASTLLEVALGRVRRSHGVGTNEQRSEHNRWQHGVHLPPPFLGCFLLLSLISLSALPQLSAFWVSTSGFGFGAKSLMLYCETWQPFLWMSLSIDCFINSI